MFQGRLLVATLYEHELLHSIGKTQPRNNFIEPLEEFNGSNMWDEDFTLSDEHISLLKEVEITSNKHLDSYCS